MDTYSSGENSTIKTRKPYTITKQRERWTEDEHNSFLEALKLYGRAWQRIEEHIGTKTAVQIRSHAQKFFTKLEKEALAKGVPIKQALNIEIPPPRPKRKPSNPYPRKTGLKTYPQVAAKDGSEATFVSSLHSGKCVLDLEKQSLPEKTGDDEIPENAKTNAVLEICSEDFSLSQEAPSVSMSSKVINPCKFREFIPPLEKITNRDEANVSYITVENKELQKLPTDGIKHTNTTSFRSSDPHESFVQGPLNQPRKCGALSENDVQGVQNYPRHVPVHIVDGKQGTSVQACVPEETSFRESTLNKMGEVREHPNLFGNVAASATPRHDNDPSRSSSNQTVPTFHPLFIPAHDNQEDHRALFHVSSTISSLIVSSLLQNPAAHAAASLAATFWHSANMEASSGEISARDYSSIQLNSAPPSMTAIAAATVAAATAWWASHGLLPVCAPLHSGYTCTPPSVFAAPVDSNQARLATDGRENSPLGGEKMDAEQPEALLKKHPPSNSAALSSSDDSDGRGDGSAAPHTKEEAPVDQLHDSTKTKVRKQVDRSSCGSNTTSSCEVETDALEKQGKDKEETKESDANLPGNDSVFRRIRSSLSPSESWKEVSEEGRLAFQALFSREVLPQSFSPPHEKDDQNITKNGEGVSDLDLNNRSQPGETNAFALLRGEGNAEEGLLTMGLGNVKFKVHHTGFKPYKRCSVEAKESKMVSTGSQNDGKGSKRMRLQGEAST